MRAITRSLRSDTGRRHATKAIKKYKKIEESKPHEQNTIQNEFNDMALDLIDLSEAARGQARK